MPETPPVLKPDPQAPVSPPVYGVGDIIHVTCGRHSVDAFVVVDSPIGLHFEYVGPVE